MTDQYPDGEGPITEAQAKPLAAELLEREHLKPQPDATGRDPREGREDALDDPALNEPPPD